MESPFEKIDGVVSAISGYAGGYVENPTYEQVSSGQTGHREAVQITYDPSRISYEKLLSVFWRQIDPTDHAGQFVDKGFQYTSAIFYHDEGQKRIAIASKKALAESDRFDKPIVTPVTEFLNFYPAEAYHQDFYLNHSLKYRYYRDRSGRDDFLNAVWGEENH